MWNVLTGKKTYLAGIATAALAVAATFDLITPEQHSTLATLLGAVFVGTVGHKVTRDGGLGK